MRKILFFGTFLCFVFIANAQRFLEAQINYPTQISDGYIVYNFYGVTDPVTFVTSDVNSNTTIGDSIIISPLIMTVPYFVAAIDSISGDTLGMMNFFLASDSATAWNMRTNVSLDSIKQTSSTYLCDGLCNMTLFFEDTTQINSLQYYLYFSQDWSQSYDSIEVSGLDISGLCPGMYLIKVYFGGLPIFSTTFYIDPEVISQPNFNVEVNPYLVSAQDTCDGSARANVLNGSPPYEYSWDGGSFVVEDSISGLCFGLHSLMVIDAVSDTVAINFGITDSLHYIQNQNQYGTPAIDTIYFITQNCSFDYNLTVDSAFINVISVIDSNTIYVETEIWQGGYMTLASDTISYTIQGINYVELVFYCGSKSYSLMEITGYINIDNINSIQHFPLSSVTKVYPNPFSKQVNIVFERSSDYKIMITDLLGKEIYKTSFSGTRKSISTSSLPSGTYLLQVISKDGVCVKKIVKD